MQEWLDKYEQAINYRLDRVDDYLRSCNNKESRRDNRPPRIGCHRVPERAR